MLGTINYLESGGATASVIADDETVDIYLLEGFLFFESFSFVFSFINGFFFFFRTGCGSSYFHKKRVWREILHFPLFRAYGLFGSKNELRNNQKRKKGKREEGSTGNDFFFL